MSIKLSSLTQCIAVPGADSIIDMIHPDTGKTMVYGKTLEDCQKEEPNAQLMHIDDFCREKAKRQDTPIEWEEITEERYMELLECLPPIMYGRNGWEGFLVGEPWDHHAESGRPRYQACQIVGGRYFASTRPLTKPEFHEAQPCPTTTNS